MTEEAPFIGTGWSFPPRFVKRGRRVVMTEGVDDIRASLAILLSTSLGERVMQPTYGCDLRSELFRKLDASLVAYMKDKIRLAVLYHEPRIKLDTLQLSDYPLEGRVDITLEYTVRGTNTRSNLVYPFYLAEGSELAG